MHVDLRCLGFRMSCSSCLYAFMVFLAPSENRYSVIWSKLHPFSSITTDTAYVVWFWRIYDHGKEFRTPQNGSLKQCHGMTFFRQYFAELLKTFESKKLFWSTWCTFSMPIALIQAVISAPWVLWGSQELLPKLMENILIFLSKPFLDGGSSLLEPKNPPMHTDTTYRTYDKWNTYASEWYQEVLGCLRVHKNVFTKIAITEVNFSHRPKIAILWVGPNCTHFRQLL